VWAHSSISLRRPEAALVGEERGTDHRKGILTRDELKASRFIMLRQPVKDVPDG
jgi:hypothetical protein